MEHHFVLHRLDTFLEMVDDVKQVAIPERLGMPPATGSPWPDMLMGLQAMADGVLQAAKIGKYLGPSAGGFLEAQSAGFRVSAHEEFLVMSEARYGHPHKWKMRFRGDVRRFSEQLFGVGSRCIGDRFRPQRHPAIRGYFHE
jgi:hypothetical protein